MCHHPVRVNVSTGESRLVWAGGWVPRAAGSQL